MLVSYVMIINHVWHMPALDMLVCARDKKETEEKKRKKERKKSYRGRTFQFPWFTICEGCMVGEIFFIWGPRNPRPQILGQ